MNRAIRIWLAGIGLALSCLLSLPVVANDHGGGGGGSAPLVFTLNLGERQYVQFGLIFETASPAVEHELQVFQPRIQHEIILLVSQKKESELRTLEGKKDLIDEIVDIANHVIHEDRKSGVKDILFSRFLIQ